MKVLLITRECLRSDSNEGNVLINLFSGQPFEFANIYCKPGIPDNSLCKGGYFQLTDSMAFRQIIKHEAMGKIVSSLSTSQRGESLAAESENKQFYNFFRNSNFEIFHLAREILWKVADFKSDALRNYIKSFSPDIIFAPLCYSRFVLSIQRYVIEQAACPAVAYIYDDIYSLRQLRFSPFFWLNRLLLRASIRKTLPMYKCFYTMSEQQAHSFEKMLNIPMRVLRKPAVSKAIRKSSHGGVKIIYAGGLYYGRDKALAFVSEVVRKLRGEGFDIRLDIYSNSPCKKKYLKKLNDGKASFVHSSVDSNELQKRYAESDIALHVESLSLKYALLTRLSFSTKIVDCLSSGCAVLAICPKINAGWQYLRDEKAAVCVDSISQIELMLRKLTVDSEFFEHMRKSAMICTNKNHKALEIKGSIASDFVELSKTKDRL